MFKAILRSDVMPSKIHWKHNIHEHGNFIHIYITSVTYMCVQREVPFCLKGGVYKRDL